MPIIFMSYAINIAVTAWLVVSFLQSLPNMDVVYGMDTPARRILGCIYAAICLASITGLLIWWGRGTSPVFVTFTITLFVLQISYKLLTGFAIGFSHPVAVANVIISTLHAVSILVLLRLSSV